ncbi:MAG: response regulator, partial [Nitrospirae bacterium]
MDREQTILIVDDDEKNVKLLTALLQAKGYNCVPAYSGQEAL